MSASGVSGEDGMYSKRPTPMQEDLTGYGCSQATWPLLLERVANAVAYCVRLTQRTIAPAPSTSYPRDSKSKHISCQ